MIIGEIIEKFMWQIKDKFPENIIPDIAISNKIHNTNDYLRALEKISMEEFNILQRHRTLIPNIHDHKDKFLVLFNTLEQLKNLKANDYIECANKQLHLIKDSNTVEHKKWRSNIKSFITDVNSNTGKVENTDSNWIKLRLMNGSLYVVLEKLKNILPPDWFCNTLVTFDFTKSKPQTKNTLKSLFKLLTDEKIISGNEFDFIAMFSLNEKPNNPIQWNASQALLFILLEYTVGYTNKEKITVSNKNREIARQLFIKDGKEFFNGNKPKADERITYRNTKRKIEKIIPQPTETN